LNSTYTKAGYPDRQLSGSAWLFRWICREFCKTNMPWNYRLSDQVQYSVMVIRTSNQASSKGLDTGNTINSNGRNSNCQCNLFWKKNLIIPDFLHIRMARSTN